MTDKTKTPAQIKTEQAYEAIERTQKLNERIKATTDNNKPTTYEQKLSCTNHPSQIRKRDKMRNCPICFKDPFTGLDGDALYELGAYDTDAEKEIKCGHCGNEIMMRVIPSIDWEFEDLSEE